MPRPILTTRLLDKLLSNLANSSEDATDSRVLANVLELPYERTSEPLRDLIRQAVVDYSIPIGSCTKGYFLVSTDEDFDAVQSNLVARKSGLTARINGLRRGWRRRRELLEEGNDWPRATVEPCAESSLTEWGAHLAGEEEGD